jgi:hypothetical protein
MSKIIGSMPFMGENKAGFFFLGGIFSPAPWLWFCTDLSSLRFFFFFFFFFFCGYNFLNRGWRAAEYDSAKK